MSPNATNATAEDRLRDLGIDLPHPPAPSGAYVEPVQTRSQLFLSGTLPLEGGVPEFVGRAQLRSLDRVMRVVRLAVSLSRLLSSVSTHGSPMPHRSSSAPYSEQTGHRLGWFTAWGA